MRILFSTVKDVGHITPLLVYARYLRDVGHDVRVSSQAAAATILQQAGLAHALVDDPVAEEMREVMGKVDALKGDDAIAVGFREGFAGALARSALPKLQQTIREWQPHLIVRESAEFASLVAAEQAGIPLACITVYCGLFEAWVAHQVAEPVDDLRRLVGLTPDGGAAQRAQRTFTAFPESLDTGSSIRDRPPPCRVATFRPMLPRVAERTRESGRPHWAPEGDEDFLYLTFGTVSGRSERVKAAYRVLLEAVGAMPVRALLTLGPVMPREDLGTIPPNIAVETFVPQSEVMPYARAVVCHGGAGTVLSTLAAGVPLAVVPLFADQPYNARAVRGAGAGVAVFDPDARALRSAIEQVLTSEEFRLGAQRVAAELASMPSMEVAAGNLLALGRR